MRKQCKTNFNILLGNAELFLCGLLSGAQGAILALANFAGKECVEIYELVQKKSFEKANDLFLRISLPAKKIVGESGVPAIKAAMDMLGYFGGEPREPLLPVDNQNKTTIESLLKAAKLL